MRPLIVIGSTEADYYGLLDHILEAEGFDAVFGGTVEEVLHLAAECMPYAVILDSRVGSFSAAKTCRALKGDPRTGDLALIALIEPGAESQFAELLEAGVDACFVRPIAPIKLLEHLRTCAGDGEGISSKTNRNVPLAYAGIEMDLEGHRVKRNGVDIHLGQTEFRLLQHLLRHPEHVCDRRELIANAWPPNVHVETRTVNVHIGRLRKALLLAGGSDLIRTVRSVGYALDENSSSGISTNPGPR
ncbi:winged helix-turn-helix domain-containing protein [Pararhizobium sp. DWP3-4]|uniref:winged helix-turn-helix domain-containing protein n=1 Tax=Pararhizobium sp. DWP3-4 TaxID=2804565 RepID=UPI003CF1A7CA